MLEPQQLNVVPEPNEGPSSGKQLKKMLNISGESSSIMSFHLRASIDEGRDSFLPPAEVTPGVEEENLEDERSPIKMYTPQKSTAVQLVS